MKFDARDFIHFNIFSAGLTANIFVENKIVRVISLFLCVIVAFLNFVHFIMKREG